MTTYTNDTYHFQLRVPETFTPLESTLPGDAPVVSIYEKDSGANPPFAFHEAPNTFFISFIPQGFGTETPNGKQQSFVEWNGSLSLQFEIDRKESTVYLLENGTPWAYWLTFSDPPEGWGTYGSIFIHLPITDFRAECLDGTTGNIKPMEDCNPLGTDAVQFFGSVAGEASATMQQMVSTLEFYEGNREETPLSELIQIERPLPNLEVASPLQIKGKAKGYWYFEGSFPITLVDASGNVLYSGSVEADGPWMTDTFVPFSKTIRFEVPHGERGYLVFEKANASGKPEMDREYRLPVIFPPK